MEPTSCDPHSCHWNQRLCCVFGRRWLQCLGTLLGCRLSVRYLRPSSLLRHADEGSVMGCLVGVITVVVNGHVNKANGGGIFEYFWLKNDVVCALCGSKTMITFIVTPLSSAIFKYLASMLDGREGSFSTLQGGFRF